MFPGCREKRIAVNVWGQLEQRDEDCFQETPSSRAEANARWETKWNEGCYKQTNQWTLAGHGQEWVWGAVGGRDLGKASERGWEMGLSIMECLLAVAYISQDGPLKPWNRPPRRILFGTEWSWGSQSRNMRAPSVGDRGTGKDQKGVESKCECFQSPCSCD